MYSSSSNFFSKNNESLWISWHEFHLWNVVQKLKTSGLEKKSKFQSVLFLLTLSIPGIRPIIIISVFYTSATRKWGRDRELNPVSPEVTRPAYYLDHCHMFPGYADSEGLRKLQYHWQITSSRTGPACEGRVPSAGRQWHHQHLKDVFFSLKPN